MVTHRFVNERSYCRTTEHYWKTRMIELEKSVYVTRSRSCHSCWRHSTYMFHTQRSFCVNMADLGNIHVQGKITTILHDVDISKVYVLLKRRSCNFCLSYRIHVKEMCLYLALYRRYSYSVAVQTIFTIWIFSGPAFSQMFIVDNKSEIYFDL